MEVMIEFIFDGGNMRMINRYTALTKVKVNIVKNSTIGMKTMAPQKPRDIQVAIQAGKAKGINILDTCMIMWINLPNKKVCEETGLGRII